MWRRSAPTSTLKILADLGTGIKIHSSHLTVTVYGLTGIDASQFAAVAAEAEKACPVSNAYRGSMTITPSTQRSADVAVAAGTWSLRPAPVPAPVRPADRRARAWCVSAGAAAVAAFLRARIAAGGPGAARCQGPARAGERRLADRWRPSAASAPSRARCPSSSCPGPPSTSLCSRGAGAAGGRRRGHAPRRMQHPWRRMLAAVALTSLCPSRRAGGQCLPHRRAHDLRGGVLGRVRHGHRGGGAMIGRVTKAGGPPLLLAGALALLVVVGLAAAAFTGACWRPWRPTRPCWCAWWPWA